MADDRRGNPGAAGSLWAAVAPCGRSLESDLGVCGPRRGAGRRPARRRPAQDAPQSGLRGEGRPGSTRSRSTGGPPRASPASARCCSTSGTRSCRCSARCGGRARRMPSRGRSMPVPASASQCAPKWGRSSAFPTAPISPAMPGWCPASNGVGADNGPAASPSPGRRGCAGRRSKPPSISFGAPTISDAGPAASRFASAPSPGVGWVPRPGGAGDIGCA